MLVVLLLPLPVHTALLAAHRVAIPLDGGLGQAEGGDASPAVALGALTVEVVGAGGHGPFLAALGTNMSSGNLSVRGPANIICPLPGFCI